MPRFRPFARYALTAALTGAAAPFATVAAAQGGATAFGVEEADEILFEADNVYRESVSREGTKAGQGYS